MAIKFFFAAVFLSLSVLFQTTRVSAQSAPRITNIFQMLQGYDIVKASPFTNPDTGRSVSYIFQETYAQNKSKGGWAEPDGIDVIPTSICSYQTAGGEFTTVKSAAEFQTGMFAAGASIAASPLTNAGFVGGAQFNNMFAGASYTNTVFVSSFALCQVYSATINIFSNPPSFTDNFRAAVLSLNVSDDASLFNFVDRFGSSYINSAFFGGVLFTYNEVTYDKFLNFSASSFGFAAAAQLALYNGTGAFVGDQAGYADFAALYESSTTRRTVIFASPVPPPVWSVVL